MRPNQSLPPEIALIDASLMVLLVLTFGLSAELLLASGYNYSEAGGGPLFKIHPATYFAAFLLSFSLLLQGDTKRWLNQLAGDHPGVIVYVAVQLIILWHAAVNTGRPLTSVGETFFPSVLAFALFTNMPNGRRRRMSLLIHAFMLANGLMALFEFRTGWRLFTSITPFGEATPEMDWRSTAILGHPLMNASITGSYMLLLALGAGRRDLTRFSRVVCFMISALALVTFGARASSALMCFFLIGIGIARLRDKAFTPQEIRIAIAVVAASVVMLAVLDYFSFFDPFIERVHNDYGSASTRIVMFDIFKHISWGEFFFGSDLQTVNSWLHRYGLLAGIESFWIGHIVNFGLIPSIVLWISLFFFLFEVIRATNSSAAWIVLYVIASCSTSTSLSTKTIILTLHVLLILILTPCTKCARSDIAPSRSSFIG